MSFRMEESDTNSEKDKLVPCFIYIFGKSRLSECLNNKSESLATALHVAINQIPTVHST